MDGFDSIGSAFAGGVRFARPWALWLMLWPAAWLLLRATRRTRVRLTGEIAGRRWRWAGFVRSLGISLAILGASGPRWGKTDREGVAVGRDVIMVIDLSRSMTTADLGDPRPRWRMATDAAADMVRAASARGGHRVGVVAFAARPKLVVPLTTDYGHVLQILAELDGDARPPDLRPDEASVSGTRIGAALRLAVESHDARFPGVQDVILLSDGDDPADDREWTAGVVAARAARVQVHCVGIGGSEDTPLVLRKRGDPDGDLVSTRLHDDVLEEIARATGGTYLPARRDPPPLADFFRRSIEPLPPRELSDDAAAVRRDHSTWFLATALALLQIAWWKGSP